MTRRYGRPQLGGKLGDVSIRAKMAAPIDARLKAGVAASTAVDVSDSSTTTSVAALATRPLSILFRLAQNLYTTVDTSSLAGNDDSLQKQILEGLAFTEAALLAVEKQSIFSPNELGEDINTADLKYLLLPFYRGELMLRVADQSKRLAALAEALKCLRGFVADQERLELLAPEAKGWQAFMGSGANADPAGLRTQKIARLKASKAAKQQLELVQAKLSKKRGGPKAGTPALDPDDSDEDGGEEEAEEDGDDLERERQSLLLKSAVFTALDSIRAAEQEADMLKQIEKMRAANGGTLPPTPTAAEEDPRFGLQMLSLLPNGQGIQNNGAVPPSGAVIRPGGATTSSGQGPLGLTTVDPYRDPSSRLSYATAMQQIHTGVIPGLYTYSVEEGLRMEEAERALEEAAKMQQMGEREEARNEAKAMREEGNDEEDEEERLKLIKQDDFREMNKRGSGNRKNRN